MTKGDFNTIAMNLSITDSVRYVSDIAWTHSTFVAENDLIEGFTRENICLIMSFWTQIISNYCSTFSDKFKLIIDRICIRK